MSGILHAPATTAGLTVAIETAPEHLVPVLLAVRDCRVGFLFAAQGSGPFVIPAKPKRAAAIVIIGDDMEQSTGPAGFHLPSIRRAIRGCDAFAVVSSAPDASVYAALRCDLRAFPRQRTAAWRKPTERGSCPFWWRS